MQVAAVADYSEVPPLPLTLILANGAVVDGVVGSDLAMAEAADEPIKRPIEEMFRAAIARAAPDEDVKELEKAVEMLGGRGLAPWLKDFHNNLSAARERLRSGGKSLKWSEMDDDDVVLLTQVTHRTAITIRDARLTLPGMEPRTVSIMRVSLSSVSCWWPREA